MKQSTALRYSCVTKYNLGTRAKIVILVPKLHLGTQFCPKLGLGKLILMALPD